MNVQRATLHRVWPCCSGKGRHSRTGRLLLSFMTLAWTVSTANSISVDLKPGGENGTATPPPTMMSYHGGMEQKMTQMITFGAISDRIFGHGSLRLSATASSHLDVSYSIIFGPAWLSGDAVSFTGPGRVSVRTSQEGDEQYHPAANVIRSFDVISTWDSWVMSHFLESERSQPSITGDNADADGDGLLNVVEYALGLDPRDPSRPFAEEAVLIIQGSDGLFVCRFTRNPDALDVSITIEESTDLDSWTPVATSVNGSVFQSSLPGYTVWETNGGSVYTVELSSPFSSSIGYFQRIVVVR